MHRALRSVLAALALVVVAHTPSLAQQVVAQAPCGVPVIVAGPNPQGATATFWNGRPIIWIDAALFYQGGALTQFTIQHECGHHMLGHVTWEGMIARQWATAQQELEADCYAARMSGPYISEPVARHFEWTQGGSSGAPGYPTGFMRAANIRQCMVARVF